ncbi:phage holin family protein [Natroniella sulfidigena]|uniref:phage holin family protein n=1 Tax=Natroniella sulfidigena TaxID=723921 RepID=UPI00200B0B32|nr:phage holin family protein [Natroniella sulfidigena]MCK8815911.1 phage holin family protein [Natroniella sulfidigena]
MTGWVGAIVRLIVSAFVLLGIGFLLPGVEVIGFTNALIAAVVIALIGYLLESVLGEDISPQGRGIVGFITAAIVIYVTQYFVVGMAVTVIGSLLAALVIGIVDAFVPTQLR